MHTVLKSVRISGELLEEVEKVRGDRNFTAVVNKALRRWLRVEKRRQEDAAIKRALSSRSAGRVREEEQLVREAAESARRVLEVDSRE